MARARIILADDHALLLDGLAAVLESRFEVVARVTDGEALVATAERERPEVVVSDVSMPKMDGLEATRALRRSRPEIKIVLVTMNGDPALAQQALHLGASAYVLKTDASTQLVAAIERALAGETYLSPSLSDDHGHGVVTPAVPLTPRQLEVLRLLGQGLTMKEVGKTLCISARTVAFHKYRMMEQLGIDTTAALLRYALSLAGDD